MSARNNVQILYSHRQAFNAYMMVGWSVVTLGQCVKTDRVTCPLLADNKTAHTQLELSAIP